MDEHKQAVLQKRIEKTMKALERNKMKPFYAKDKGEALRIVQSLLQPGQTITCGGSVTLSECGIIDLLRSGQYHYLDRDRPDLTPEQKKQIFRQAFSADVYLMSSNAVTEEGELYNVDGNSNRVGQRDPAALQHPLRQNRRVYELPQRRQNLLQLPCQRPAAPPGPHQGHPGGGGAGVLNMESNAIPKAFADFGMALLCPGDHDSSNFS